MSYEITIDGIPALAEVTSFYQKEAEGMSAHSADDCYGYIDMEYEIKDRGGYPREGNAEWLVKKAQAKDLWAEIDEQILTAMQEY